MTGSAFLRVPSCAGVPWSASAVGAGVTTGRWRDKTAHVARRSGGCCCWVFWRASHVAAILRTVRGNPNALIWRHFLNVARFAHGR